MQIPAVIGGQQRGLRPLIFTDGCAAPPDIPEARQAAAVLLSPHSVGTAAQVENLVN